jgi:hypothetical protein
MPNGVIMSRWENMAVLEEESITLKTHTILEKSSYLKTSQSLEGISR